MDRRELLKSAGVFLAAPVLTALAGAAGNATPPAAAPDVAPTPATAPPPDDRAFWINTLRRLADPVLNNLATGTLRARMPVEQASDADRVRVTHLEAAGRLLAGLAPWIELPADDSDEGRQRAAYAELVRRAIDRGVDPSSRDFLNFTEGRQPLVDAAYLAQALVRARRELVEKLPPATAQRLVRALEATRAIQPPPNNWVMFPAMIEAGLATLGVSWNRPRVEEALRRCGEWYRGDGFYGDGPEFHWDYYNSYVIHPMLLEVMTVLGNELPAWKELASREKERARRYAAILERLIAPDGSYPAVGRSLAYRCGAFHLLARQAWRHELPEGVLPAQVRGALTAVIRRTLDAPGTFDDNGWLRIGLCGHQRGIGETYISTGSLYLCTLAFLPLGLPASDEFWSAPAKPWTSVKAWSGQPFPIDRALTT